jgi:hypothetical protein
MVNEILARKKEKRRLAKWACLFGLGWIWPTVWIPLPLSVSRKRGQPGLLLPQSSVSPARDWKGETNGKRKKSILHL